MVKKVTIDSILGYGESTPVAIEVIPAYGRNYSSAAAALTDWKAGKDFKIVGGPYCSIRDVNHLKMIGDFVSFLSRDGKTILSQLSI